MSGIGRCGWNCGGKGVALKIVTAHWLDHVHLWIFFAMVPSIFILAVIGDPLRRAWLAESRQWLPDEDVRHLDESCHNKTGENFWRWLKRNGHHRIQTSVILLSLLTPFIIVWPFISRDYCCINKCRGQFWPCSVEHPR